MSDLPPFIIVSLPGATIAIDGGATSSVVVRLPSDDETGAMIPATEAGDPAGISAFYSLAGLSVDQADALPEPTLDALVAGITQAVALVLQRRAAKALAYDPFEK
ncbi:hypothetical protein [Bosea sp. MMO-172]|uniref:hypothetical protein n=1 Tax=Bosea sp. MMO-172 TaxID=3127885 RepID=UPI0030167711